VYIFLASCGPASNAVGKGIKNLFKNSTDISDDMLSRSVKKIDIEQSSVMTSNYSELISRYSSDPYINFTYKLDDSFNSLGDDGKWFIDDWDLVNKNFPEYTDDIFGAHSKDFGSFSNKDDFIKFLAKSEAVLFFSLLALSNDAEAARGGLLKDWSPAESLLLKEQIIALRCKQLSDVNKIKTTNPQSYKMVSDVIDSCPTLEPDIKITLTKIDEIRLNR